MIFLYKSRQRVQGPLVMKFGGTSLLTPAHFAFAADLVAQITRCSGNVGANLTPQDKQHLGAYLNTFYKLK